MFKFWSKKNSPAIQIVPDEPPVRAPGTLPEASNADDHREKARECLKLGDWVGAADAYRLALETAPHEARTWVALAYVLERAGDAQHSEAALRQAIRLHPDIVDARYMLASQLTASGRGAEAISVLQELIAIDPDFARAYGDLCRLFLRELSDHSALTAIRQLVVAHPDQGIAQWALVMAPTQQTASIKPNQKTGNEQLLTDLKDFSRWLDTHAVDGSQLVGEFLPFHLAYREINNRDALEALGVVCNRMMEEWRARRLWDPVQPSRSSRIRIGIASFCIFEHSVWHAFVRGWLDFLDRERFELHIFFLRDTGDEQTLWASQHADSFTTGLNDTGEWAQSILSHDLDILIYPEIGMHGPTIRLASMRLARHQIAAWGHPETSGLPTIDYYLTAEQFEPENAERHYTESLIKLPQLAAFYYPMRHADAIVDFQHLAIALDRPILICPGSAFKYAPEHDWVLAEIALRLGPCQLVFFDPQTGGDSARLRERLHASFAERGLDSSSFCRWIPWQPPPHFHTLMRSADVFLDTIGFSGFNTVMEAFECALPVVTREGRFMRGRLGSGILRQAHLEELITPDETAYIDLAVKLALDPIYRDKVRQSMVAAREALYCDRRSISALEDFMSKLCER
jgi:predicted O-linked N-acetylglucosamine transferase (SPINDLY family)